VTRRHHKHQCLREAIPLCEQNRYRKIHQTQQKVIYCYTMQLVSTQLYYTIRHRPNPRPLLNYRVEKNTVELQSRDNTSKTKTTSTAKHRYQQHRNNHLYTGDPTNFFHHMEKQVTTHLIHSVTRPPQVYTVKRCNIHLNKCCTEAQPYATH
jgi:hypothetical protein